MLLLALITPGTLLARQGVPAPWASREIGAPVPAGGASVAASVFTVKGGGADIWGTTDQFSFVYQALSGNTDLIANVESLTATDAWAKAGLMMRASLAPDAAHGLALISAGKGAAFQRRVITGGTSTHTAGPAGGAPRWLRLLRIDTTVTAFSSTDGRSWLFMGSDRIPLGRVAYVGLAVTSHDSGRSASAAFSAVSIRTLGVPAPQLATDIGAPRLVGTTSYGRGRYTTVAAGRDVWSTADQFHFVYQPMSGDIDVSVRLRSLTRTDPWAKSGVMIRETLSPGSRHAFALLSSARGYAFHRRVDTNGFTEAEPGVVAGVPGWVRLVRSGSRFEAFRSTDGITWRSMGTDVVPMNEAVYVGIATTSHNITATTLAELDFFRLRPQSPMSPAPTTAPPTSVVFQASVDHATLTSYRLDIFPSGADPATATAAATSDLGKPAPDAAGDISVNRATFFSVLAPGNYQATVSSVGSSGSARSAPVAFTR